MKNTEFIRAVIWHNACTAAWRAGCILAPIQPSALSTEYAHPAQAIGQHSAVIFSLFPIETTAEEHALQRVDSRNRITDC